MVNESRSDSGRRLYFLREIYADRPGSQTIHAFNRSLESAGPRPLRHQPSERLTNIARHLDDRDLLRNLFQLPGRAFIVALMWPKVARLFPVGYFGEIIPLCFDCWPLDYDRWELLFRKNRVKTAFFTARQSQEYFSSRIPRMKSHWLPEAADPREYPFTKSLFEREVDVFELGRRSDSYHAAIEKPLRRDNRTHLYNRELNQRLFPTREELMNTWEKTKISVCFPKSITSPESSGGVETVTFRYFESMASRCLVVGYCPAELFELFGYNPIIEVDWDDPGGQILRILGDIKSYQELVERNHKRMLEVGSWDVRAQEMINLLEMVGYRI